MCFSFTLSSPYISLATIAIINIDGYLKTNPDANPQPSSYNLPPLTTNKIPDLPAHRRAQDHPPP